MRDVKSSESRRYQVKIWFYWSAILFAVAMSLVFLSVVVSPESWTFGTSITRFGRRVAPVLLVGAVGVTVFLIALLRRGPVRVDGVGIFNPFAKRRDRLVAWSEVADIRTQRGGKNLEILTVSGRRSVVTLDLLKSPDRFEQEILAAWRERQANEL